MVRFEMVSTTEKAYPYVDAIADAEYKNGTFGAVADGVFKAGATGFYVIMNMENGDDAKSDDYVVHMGEKIRVADLAKVNGASLSITSAQLPASVAKGNKLVSKEDGTLSVSETATEKYIEVTEITTFGVNAKVVA